MGRNIFAAHKQWSSRPDDERFYDVMDALPVVQSRSRLQRNALISVDNLHVVEMDGGEIGLQVAGAQPAMLNAHSYKQLCTQIGVDASATKRYPASIIIPQLEYSLKQYSGVSQLTVDEEEDTDDDASALFCGFGQPTAVQNEAAQLNLVLSADNDRLNVRAVTGSTYGFYGDLKLFDDAKHAYDLGWRTPRCRPVRLSPRNRTATADDVFPFSLIQEGEEIGPGGVYVGIQNTFLFFVHPHEVLPGQYPAVVISNTEYADGTALKATFCTLNYVCGNHIMWNCANVHSVSKRHKKGSIGQFTDEFRESLGLVSQMKEISDITYKLAINTDVASNKEEVIDTLFQNKRWGLTRRVCERAVECAESHPEDHDNLPITRWWSVCQGLTRYANSLGRADAKNALDKIAGSMLDSLDVSRKALTVAVNVDSPTVVEKPSKRKVAKTV